jgi:hypothetical protein
MTTTDDAIDKVFAASTFDARARVIFRELLAMTIKYASLHPDRDANDLIARAKAISAAFKQ